MIEWAIVAVAAPTGAWAVLAAWLDWMGGTRPDRSADALLVAGCRVRADGSPSPALARRVALAAALFREGRAPRVVFTGGIGRGASVSEARAAATFAASLGVPWSAVVLEERSRDTRENAAEAARVWEALVGAPAAEARVLVVTDRSHVFRASRMFGAHFEVVGAAGATPPPRSRIRMALREGASVVHHALRGRLRRRAPLGLRP